MKTRAINLFLVTNLLLFTLQPLGRDFSTSEIPTGADHPPTANAGRDFVTYVAQPTEFRGYGSAPETEVVMYEWDFDGDGVYDFQSTQTGITTSVYTTAGTYQAALRITDTYGNIARDTLRVVVEKGTGTQRYLPSLRVEPVRKPPSSAEADGTVERYAVMINGGSETRFWDDVTFMYSTLIDDYSFSPDQIYLLNYEGTNPDGLNPEGMIDYPATLANIDTVFTDLSTTLDGDDELFLWVTDHGRGYTGPQAQSYGYLDGFASVDPGDEQDVLETDFKLRSLTTYGNYATPYFNHGMNVFKVYYAYFSSQGAYRMYRNKYVSTFTNEHFEIDGFQTDSDVFIEKLVDYLLGDTDRDGYVETDQGEVFDYDSDGVPPYDPATGIFDEDDWGDLDYYEDNFNNINSRSPGDNYILFDQGFDNHLDIDINYDPDHLEVDGTDLDNQGLFDGIDVNDDGDMEDWVSIDETIALPGDDMIDDDLAIFIERIDASVVSVFMEQCFSGGFIDDLSAPNRVISTATKEDALSWGNLFAELFTTALHQATRHGAPRESDADQNGHISMREAFTFAAENDIYDEIPQYDDNGDELGHSVPIPQGGDGELGGRTYLESFYALTLIPDIEARSGDPGETITYTLHVTNLGSVTDTFDVTVSGCGWLTTAPAAVGPLSPGSSEEVEVVVNIPADAPGGSTDTATITATSQGNSAMWITADLTTEANVVEPPLNYLFLPVVLK